MVEKVTLTSDDVGELKAADLLRQSRGACKRKVTVLVRDKSGKLSIAADRQEIACDDDLRGVHQHVEANKKEGASAVIVLGEHDTALFHWER